MHAPIDLAPKVMKNAILKRRALGRDNPAGGSNKYYEAKNAEEKFHAARVTAFGSGRCRPYANAWHPEYGLHTEEDDQIILRLNDEKDRTAFYNDVINEPRKLVFAEGIGRHLFMVPKSVSLSGSLKPRDWKGQTVGMSITYGWPLFALPHFADVPLEKDNQTPLSCLAMIWNSAPIFPVFASPLPASIELGHGLPNRATAPPEDASCPLRVRRPAGRTPSWMASATGSSTLREAARLGWRNAWLSVGTSTSMLCGAWFSASSGFPGMVPGSTSLQSPSPCESKP